VAGAESGAAPRHHAGGDGLRALQPGTGRWQPFRCSGWPTGAGSSRGMEDDAHGRTVRCAPLSRTTCVDDNSHCARSRLFGHGVRPASPRKADALWTACRGAELQEGVWPLIRRLREGFSLASEEEPRTPQACPCARLASHYYFRPPPAGSRLDREDLTHSSRSSAVKTPSRPCHVTI